MADSRTSLKYEISAFLRSPGRGFDDLAQRVFARQFKENAPYRAFCESLDVTPDRLASWEEIPALPTDAFKADLPLTTFPLEEAARIFLTSGTTGEVRGRHYFRDTELYESAVLEGWREAGLPEVPTRLFLARNPAQTRDSSLACMFGFLAGSPARNPWLLDESDKMRIDALRRACSGRVPVLLFSTALTLRHLCAEGESLPLPAGSWIFQTGGYKGLATEEDPATLYARLTATFGVPAEQIINEYGMTELSSQCYALGLDAPHRAPPWLRFRILDPETNQPQKLGEPGYLALYDLANLDSVLAVRTQDFATALDDSRFVLHGRDPAALPRGCSRASDDLFSNQ